MNTDIDSRNYGKLPLTEEQIDILMLLRVPLYHHNSEGRTYIARGYWESIKPSLRNALIRVLRDDSEGVKAAQVLHE